MTRQSCAALFCLALLVPLDAAVPAGPRSTAEVAGARLDRWEVIGPGGGGTMTHPTISPHDPKVVLVGCDMTGAYITYDGGESWRMINLGSVVSSFAFDPVHPDVIYAANPALWRSSDRGRSWRMVFPDPNRHTREMMIGDHAEYVVRTEDPLYPPASDRTEVQAVAVAPDGAVTIAVSGRGVVKGSAGNRVRLLSSDDAQHWTIKREFSADRVLSMTAGAARDLAVVTERQVDSAPRLDVDRAERSLGPPMQAASVVPGAGGATTVYALTETAWSGTGVSGGVFVSEDGGAVWRQALRGLTDGITERRVRATASLSRRVSVSRPRRSGVRRLRRPAARGRRGRFYNGVARTNDGGRTWRIVHRESNKPSPTMAGSWLEERAVMPGPDIWFDAPYDLGVSPRDPDIVYVTDLFRTYRTLDGGGNWAQVHSEARRSRSSGPRGVST